MNSYERLAENDALVQMLLSPIGNSSAEYDEKAFLERIKASALKLAESPFFQDLNVGEKRSD